MIGEERHSPISAGKNPHITVERACARVLGQAGSALGHVKAQRPTLILQGHGFGGTGGLVELETLCLSLHPALHHQFWRVCCLFEKLPGTNTGRSTSLAPL
jgi:hypothetical protein